MRFSSIIGSRVPVFVGARTVDGGAANVSSVDCPLPSGIVPGDMLLLIAGARRGAPASFVTPAGWTLLVNNISGDTLRQGAVFYKVASGSEGASVTVTPNLPSVLIAGCIAVRGVTQINGSAQGSNGIPDPPPLNAGFTASLWMAVEIDIALPTGVIAMPPNYTLVPDSHHSLENVGANYLRMSAAYQYLQASSETPGDFNPGSTGQYVAATIALA